MIEPRECHYVHLRPGGDPPSVDHLAPFVAVTMLAAPVSDEWRDRVCRWLVDSGARYVCTWGLGCRAWETAVDMAYLEPYDWFPPHDAPFIVTTQHEGEPLAELAWFVASCDRVDDVELARVLLVDIRTDERGAVLLQTFADVNPSG